MRDFYMEKQNEVTYLEDVCKLENIILYHFFCNILLILLHGIQLGVKSVFRYQFSVSSLFNNPVIVDHNNPVGVFYCGETMCNGQACPALH